ncbi:MAG: polyketide synthase regulator [Aeromicrobium sp.]|jgi:DNA-binding PucR family transcriptional regulator|uniref:PucR family transcriptional regulator n=1 Tax=Aeromicrobium sp. TaxID=1871063 RepID=UPI00261440A5|nr:helix-turn-helix domain-containing protein [Aeromicrobium sp.]MCW2789101.1 polyketide synthase regulator [Aeromicrobium sp.]MCW2826199.1 polyketide synthase regulator [Aeromicrobium sp.]
MSDHVPHRRTVPPGSPEAAEIAGLTAVVGERLQRRYDELNASMNDAIEEAIADLGDPELTDLLHASVEGNIATILYMLRNDIPLERIQPITAATEYAIRLAQRGVSGASLRRAYHFGSDDLLGQAFEEVRQIDVDPDTRLRLLHHLAGWMHSYVDWITGMVLAAYEDERRQVEERSASIAASLVRGVLDDAPGAQQGFAERTGYRLDQHHVAGVVWMAAANAAVDHTDGLKSLADELAGATLSTGALFTPVDRSTAWVWWGRGTDDGPLASDVVRTVLAEHEHARVALGEAGRGVAGFRTSHRQAGAARDLASVARTGQQLTSHSDRAVAVVSMLLHDLNALAGWVTAVLGPLSANTDNAARLRETLLTFLVTGSSYQVTGERLLLHRNTVKYRVGRAFELRGRSLDEDRLDVELALEVVRLLGDVVLQ